MAAQDLLAREALLGVGMRCDHHDHADIDPEGHRPGTLVGTHTAVVDQFLTIEVADA